MKCQLFVAALLLFTASLGIAQPYHRYRYIGQAGDDQIFDFTNASGSDFIAVGSIKGANGTIVHGTTNAKDGLVAKVSPNGGIVWAYSYGGDLDDEFYRVVRHQGFYYCFGYTKSYRISGDATKADMFLVKIDENGVVQWARNIGNPTTVNGVRQNDVGFLVTETSGQDIIVIGTTGSGSTSDSDIIIFRVTPNGTLVFGKNYNDNSLGYQQAEFAREVLRYGNEYVMACQRYASYNSIGSREAMLIKMNENGGKIWARKLDFPGTDAGSTGIYSLHLDIAKNKIATGGFYYDNTSNPEPVIFNDIRWTTGAQTLAAAPRATVYSVNTKAYVQAQVFSKGNNLPGAYINFIGSLGSGTAEDVIMANVDSLYTPIQQQRLFGGGGYEQIRRPVSVASGNDVINMGFTNSAPSCSYDILFNRLQSNLNFDSTSVAHCNRTTNIQITNMTYANTDMLNDVVVSDLDASWFATINSFPARIDVTNALSLRYDRCGCSVGAITSNCNTSGGPAAITVVQNGLTGETEVKGELDPTKKQNISYFYFKIYDVSDIIYYETDKEVNLQNGVKLKKGQKDLSAGLYFWQYEATLKDGTTHRQAGSFTIK